MKAKIVTNADLDLVDDIKVMLKSNQGYCPSKKEHIPENKCMCASFKAQEEGMCDCGLYIKIKR